MNYQVLLYYIYTPLEDIERYRDIHHLFCLENQLFGRIIIASEGLNGTVSGTPENCRKYREWLHSDPRFKSIDFKIEFAAKIPFQKLNVRLKSEIVNSDLPVNPLEKTGIYLSHSEFKKIKDEEGVVLVDMRSTYEHQVGKFKEAITFPMENLRELPEHIKEIEHLKDKKIITYCTGGVKCEKASAYLLSKGFKNVYQLHGGIIKYGLEEGGEDFEGKCYVFDNRVAVEVNKVNPKTISTCYLCHIPCEHIVNCSNPDCNNHVVICPKCLKEMEGACSSECKKSERKRPYTPTGYYSKTLEGYTPALGFKSRKRNEEAKID